MPVSTMHLTILRSQKLRTRTACWMAGLIGIGAQGASAQSLRINSFAISGSEIQLRWSGAAPRYLVQRATDLGTPNWHTALSTSETNALISPDGSQAFYRVASTQPLDEARRSQILEEIDQKAGSLPGTGAGAELQELAAFLAGYPELQNISVTENSCVWAEFSDGRFLTLVGNRPSEPVPQALPGGVGLSPTFEPGQPLDHSSSPGSHLELAGQSAGARTPPTGIPKSNKVYLLSFLPVVKDNPLALKAAPEMKAWFEEYGYNVVQQDATVEALEAVKDAGVFYYEGHTAFNAEWKRFIMLTATPSTEPVPPRFREDLHYAILIRPKVPRPGKYYSITPDFVRKYMRFSDSSFVFINSCETGHSDAAPLRAAFMAGNASLFGGWTSSAGELPAWRAARYLFDRLLGVNRAGGALAPDFIEIPAQRAFDFDAVLKAMHEHQPVPLDQTQVGNHPPAQLGFSSHPRATSRFGLLAPSIRAMWVDEEKEELHLYGLFDPGSSASVVVDGKALLVQPATVLSPTEIVCPLPAKGLATAGNVWVYQGQQQSRSNRAPLTEWWVKARLQRYFAPGNPEPSATIELNLHFRTDVHRSRRAPHEPPVFAGNSARAASDSTCRLVSASGIYHDPNGIRTVEWSLPEQVDIPISYQGFTPGQTAFSGQASFLQDGSIGLTFAAFAKDRILATEKQDGRSNTSPFEPGTRTFPAARAQFIPLTYNILAGEGTTAGDAGKATWELAVATSPPDEQSPGFGASRIPDPSDRRK